MASKTLEKPAEKAATTTKPAGEPRPAANGESSPARTISPTRQRDLDAAISTIQKTYGDGSIMRLGEARARTVIEVISTGALGLDLALGVGGIPRGRVIEIFGPESSGKTTLM